MNKVKIGISACLLGMKVRYDGGHKQDHYLTDTLGGSFQWVPVCPEVECGLGVPREAMRLEGSPEDTRLVTKSTKVDHTSVMRSWTGKRLGELDREDICGFVFKSRSPSSGMAQVKIYDPGHNSIRTGRGIFAGAFMDTYPMVPVEDECRLHDPDTRENFIGRVFTLRRWKDISLKGMTRHRLIEFHASHKYLIMAHSPSHLKALGQLVAASKERSLTKVSREYGERLMIALRLKATVRKNTNVLQHIAGYFKERLSKGEKQEIKETISGYHKGMVPLIVPVTLLNHYSRKYSDNYLKQQYYLHPNPEELMLRNHA